MSGGRSRRQVRPVREGSTIVIFQTAFPGDVVLTLPLAQGLKRLQPGCSVSMVVIPKAAELLQNHPDISEIIVYDKRRADAGVAGFWRLAKELRSRRFDVALIPHRSFRSAALATAARVPRRIGFDTSAGRFLLTDTVRYEQSIHEIGRNASLVTPLVGKPLVTELPSLFPSDEDRIIVDDHISEKSVDPTTPMVGIAPGSVWNTKRWLEERFRELIMMSVGAGYRVILIGGSEDKPLCERLRSATDAAKVCSMAGKLTLLQSAEAIRRCAALVSNDSAPMHLAVAMRTPVVAVFGPTIPGFGFAPNGKHDRIVQIDGLPCRPCSIHGGDTCPIGTFDCMVKIRATEVFDAVQEVINGAGTSTP